MFLLLLCSFLAVCYSLILQMSRNIVTHISVVSRSVLVSRSVCAIVIVNDRRNNLSWNPIANDWTTLVMWRINPSMV